MTRKIIIIVCALACITASTPSLYATEDQIIAVVNDDIVTLKELRDFVSAVYLRLLSSGKTDAEIKEELLAYQERGINKLIEERLIVQEADKKGLTVNEDGLNAQLKEVKQHYGSDILFRQALSREGITITDLLNTLRDQMKVKSLIDREVHSKIFINPQEITDYYEAHTNDFHTSERVNLDSIFIPYKNGDSATARKICDEAVARLKEPNADFAAIAKEYSQSPSIGIIEKGHCLEEIDTVVFNLNEGDISDPIETSGGIYILKVKEKIPSEQSGIEEVRDKIYQMLYNEKFKEQITNWLSNLKKKAYIEIKS